MTSWFGKNRSVEFSDSLASSWAIERHHSTRLSEVENFEISYLIVSVNFEAQKSTDKFKVQTQIFEYE